MHQKSGADMPADRVAKCGSWRRELLSGHVLVGKEGPEIGDDRVRDRLSLVLGRPSLLPVAEAVEAEFGEVDANAGGRVA